MYVGIANIIRVPAAGSASLKGYSTFYRTVVIYIYYSSIDIVATSLYRKNIFIT